MKDVLIYTKATCPYCTKAKALFNEKNITFEEIDVANNPDLIQEMIERSGATTVPQIFIDGESIGGYSDLYAMYQSGMLDFF